MNILQYEIIKLRWVKRDRLVELHTSDGRSWWYEWEVDPKKFIGFTGWSDWEKVKFEEEKSTDYVV